MTGLLRSFAVDSAKSLQNCFFNCLFFSTFVSVLQVFLLRSLLILHTVVPSGIGSLRSCISALCVAGNSSQMLRHVRSSPVLSLPCSRASSAARSAHGLQRRP